jgi:hypothetical protein
MEFLKWLAIGVPSAALLLAYVYLCIVGLIYAISAVEMAVEWAGL